MAVVEQPEPAVREAEHPVRVGALAGDQARATGRATRGGRERLAEQDALIGQQLDVRREHAVAVGLHVAAGVVRVQVEDVGLRAHAGCLRSRKYRATQSSLTASDWRSVGASRSTSATGSTPTSPSTAFTAFSGSAAMRS